MECGSYMVAPIRDESVIEGKEQCARKMRLLLDTHFDADLSCPSVHDHRVPC